MGDVSFNASFDTQASIGRAAITTTTALRRGEGSELIAEVLHSVAGAEICLVTIERDGMRFTLVLDPDWARLGLELLSEPREIVAEFPLEENDVPRAALRAVVQGWPAGWDVPRSPKLAVHVSADEIPHISLIDQGFDLPSVSRRSTTGVHPGSQLST